jgi:hypothetical protein
MDFELFGGLNPGTARVSTKNSKDIVILDRCAIFRPATALVRIIEMASRSSVKMRERYPEPYTY